MGKRRTSAATPRPLSRVVAVGASMGGVQALRALFATVPPDVDAAFVVVLHRSSGKNLMSAILTRSSRLPAQQASDGDRLERGRIYVAPPGFHTTVEGDRVRVAIGPRENGNRPSVDVLFRSVARTWTTRAIGVVLSGALDCGTSGLVEIKRRGGVGIVQDPDSAVNPQMPVSALDAVKADHVATPPEMGPIVARLSARPPPRAKRARAPQKGGEQPSSLGCPECNGPIWESPGGFRCRVGHRYTPDGFFAYKERRLEAALWEALNVMQERIELSRRMASRARENGHEATAAAYDSRADDTAENAALLRDLIYQADGSLPVDEVGQQASIARKAKRRRK